MHWYKNASKTIDVDWNRVKELALQGKSTPEIATEIGINEQTLQKGVRRTFLMPDSPMHDLEVIRRLKENGKAAFSRSLKAKWQNPEFRRQMSEMSREMWQDPKRKEKMRARMREMIQTPENKQRLHEMMVQRWQDPEYAKSKRDQAIQMWQNPLHKERDHERRQTPEERQRISDQMKARWRDDKEYRAKIEEVLSNLPQKKDFWNWLSKFDPAKQAEILSAIRSKNKEQIRQPQAPSVG